jgi:hypothetical protein
MFPRRADAIPWLLTFNGTLNPDSGPVIQFTAEFIYEDAHLPLEGQGFTPIVYASVVLDDELVFSQDYPGGKWTPGPNPLGSSYVNLRDALYGPVFYLPSTSLPAGYREISFDETRVFFEYDGDGLSHMQCGSGLLDLGTVTRGCGFAVTQLITVPEPSSLLWLVGLIATAGVTRLTLRSRNN